MKNTTIILFAVVLCVTVTNVSLSQESKTMTVVSLDIPGFLRIHLPEFGVKDCFFFGFYKSGTYWGNYAPEAILTYRFEAKSGIYFNIHTWLFSDEDTAAKGQERMRWLVSIGTMMVEGLGNEAHRPPGININPDGPHYQEWVCFRRRNISISVASNQAFDKVLDLAKRMDEEIQYPTGFVQFGDPTTRLALAMPGTAVDEDKTFEFGLNLPKEEELIQVKASARVGICESLEDRPGVYRYTPRELGPDEISVAALLKGERVLSTTCAIEVRESADRKARIAELVRRLDTEPNMDWKDCCKVLEELLGLVDTREKEYGTVFLKYIGPERHSFVRDRAILLIRQVADPRAISPLIELLKAPIRGDIRDDADDEAIVRREAVRALGEIADASAIPFLRSIVESPNEYPSVREFADHSIRQIEGTAPRDFNK